METILDTEDLYNLLTGRTPMALNRVLALNFRANGIDLTREQWSVMAVLWKNDGCSQRYLADRTYRDKPGITRLVDNLEKSELVKRSPDATDRRLNLIRLTDKGKSLEPGVMKVVDDTIKIALKAIDMEKIRNLKETFQLIYNNLEVYGR